MNFKKDVLEQSGLILVDFTADWCVPCKRMKPVLEKIQQANRILKIVEVDADANQYLAAQLGISSIPAFAFFKNGKQVETLIGPQTANRLQEVINAHRGSATG